MLHRFLLEQNHSASASRNEAHRTSSALYLTLLIFSALLILVLALIIVVLLKKRQEESVDSDDEFDESEMASVSSRKIPRIEPFSPDDDDDFSATNHVVDVPGARRKPVFPPKRKTLFSLEELSEATGQFGKGNLLLSGSTFRVYRGMLKSGRSVAVKQMQEREFKHEARILRQTKHKNVVSLIGYCKYQGGGTLVYEFVSDKSLFDHLHWMGERLDWNARMKIVIGIARAVAYLHREDGKPVIIHRNIVPSSILVDSNFEPKLSGFEYARMGRKKVPSTKLPETSGFLAPELSRTGIYTEKSDVYAYGVLVLEMVTGRKTVGKNAHSLVDLLCPLMQLPGQAVLKAPIVDSRLGDRYDKDEFLKLIDIALGALRILPESRPSMRRIVQCFEGNYAPSAL